MRFAVYLSVLVASLAITQTNAIELEGTPACDKATNAHDLAVKKR